MIRFAAAWLVEYKSRWESWRGVRRGRWRFSWRVGGGRDPAPEQRRHRKRLLPGRSSALAGGRRNRTTHGSRPTICRQLSSISTNSNRSQKTATFLSSPSGWSQAMCSSDAELTSMHAAAREKVDTLRCELCADRHAALELPAQAPHRGRAEGAPPARRGLAKRPGRRSAGAGAQANAARA